MKLGYARISTSSQDHQLQVDALNAAGVDEIITDTISGSSKKREGLDRLLDKAREGDTIVVWRLDRLGRSLSHLIQLVEQLKARGIGFKSLQEEINTDTANGMFFFHMIGALATFERSLIVERTRAGLEAAKEQGRVGGRPAAMTPEQEKLVLALVEQGQNRAEICNSFDISRATLYRLLAKHKG